MSTEMLIVNDYKKWLLYNFDNQGFESHYQLFKAIKSGENFGAIAIRNTDDGGVRSFTISHESVNAGLQISENHRADFMKYLVDNYFHSEDVDSIMVQKRQQSERNNNHAPVEGRREFVDDVAEGYTIRQHRKERTYYNTMLSISGVIYTILAIWILYGVMTDVSFVFAFLGVVVVLLFMLLASKFAKGIFVGIIRGNSIQVTKDQFPEIYDIVKAQAQKLGIRELPEIYVTSGRFNAFVTKFSRAHLLMIYSEVIETTLNGNYDVLKYVTAHELGHIRQKHLLKDKYLFPARIVPFLSLAYSRGCEYTCDRVGFDFAPKGSLEGLLILTTGKEIHAKFNIEKHIKNALETEGFWTALSEKFLSHPHLYKRLVEIKKYSSYR